MWEDWCAYKRRERLQSSLSLSLSLSMKAQRKVYVRTYQVGDHLQTMENSPEMDYAGTFILDFLASRTKRK